MPISAALPLGGAFLLGGANRMLPRVARDVIALVVAMATTGLTLVLAAASGGVTIYWFAGWHPVDGVVIGVDYAVGPLGAGLASLAGLLVSSAILYSWRFFDTVSGLFHSLVLIFLAASVDFCLTGDLFNLFVAFELVAVTGFVLTGYAAGKTAPLQGAINFAVSNSLAGMVVLLGVALLYARTGALNLAQIGQRLADHPADGLVVAAFALLTGGFLVKAAAVPFHFWLPDAYGTAPIPVCVLFSGVMSELGLFAVARVWVTIFSGLPGAQGFHLRAVFVGFGVATAVLGPVLALAQTQLKRMLAFLTMSHLGLYLIAFGLLSPLGVAGAGLLAVGDGLAKGAMFFGVGILQKRRSSVDEMKLKGQGKARGLIVAGAVVALGALVAADLPPFASAIGKNLLIDAADPLGMSWLELVVAFCVIGSSGAVLRAAGRIWLDWGPALDEPSPTPEAADDPGDPGEQEAEDEQVERADGDPAHPEEEEPTEDSQQGGRDRVGTKPPLVLMIAPVALLAAALALGLVPEMAQRAVDAASSFTNRTAYEAAVIQGAGLFHANTAVPPVTLTKTIINVCEAVGALALGALALSTARWMASVRRGAVISVAWLRRVHTGHVGDQVTWLLIGIVILAAASGLAMR